MNTPGDMETQEVSIAFEDYNTDVYTDDADERLTAQSRYATIIYRNIEL